MSRRKDKYISQEDALGVEDLAAIVERSARGREARAPKSSSERSGDEGLMPLESLLEAQIDFNNAVGGSIKIIAQHLLYMRKRLEAFEESRARTSRTKVQPAEHSEELSGALRSLAQSVDSLTSRLSELEQRFGRELDEIRRSLRAPDSSSGKERKRRNRRGA